MARRLYSVPKNPVIQRSTVDEDDAKRDWRKCQYYGGEFRIEEDGRLLYRVIGPAEMSPDGFGKGHALKLYKVVTRDYPPEMELISKELLTPTQEST